MVIKNIRFGKLRLWMVYPVFFIYPFVARFQDATFALGLGFIFLGELVRFWASGYISKNRSLATSGPYAFVRNPLYVGNFLIGFGVVVVSSNPWLMAYYLVWFLFLYTGTIRKEEQTLETKFGKEFRAYLKAVPMLVPSLKPYRGSSGGKFRISQSFKNGEFIRAIGFFLLGLFFVLIKSLFVDRLVLKSQAGVILLFIVFFLFLWFNIYIRRKSERRA